MESIKELGSALIWWRGLLLLNLYYAEEANGCGLTTFWGVVQQLRSPILGRRFKWVPVSGSIYPVVGSPPNRLRTWFRYHQCVRRFDRVLDGARVSPWTFPSPIPLQIELFVYDRHQSQLSRCRLWGSYHRWWTEPVHWPDPALSELYG